jgi:hypothetical protein
MHYHRRQLIDWLAPGLRRSLVDIAASQSRLEKQMTALTDAIAQLQAQVQAAATEEQAAITLLNGIKAQLDLAIFNNGNTVDPQVLKDLSAQIAASTAALANAVVTDTPKAGTPGKSAVAVLDVTAQLAGGTASDGQSLTVGIGTVSKTYTWKTTSPGTGQYNSAASLAALLTADFAVVATATAAANVVTLTALDTVSNIVASGPASLVTSITPHA